jgi:hypothetical protein
MVLDKKFPANSKARGDLIILLRTDVSKALEAVSNGASIDIMDMLAGSINDGTIVHFRFVNDSNKNITWLEEEYLKQVDDKKSRLYEGTATCHIDQQRTQALTMQLGSHLVHTPCPYRVGDTITLTQVDNEAIKCTVDSLLGEGATATVFKVTTNGKSRALKVFKAENSLEDLCQEASLLLTSSHPQSHPNMLRADFVWYEQRTHEMFFLMNLVDVTADGTDLRSWMGDERLYAGTVQEQEHRLTLITHQLGCALQHLHKLGILHQDVKPDNVLMTVDGSPVLADVGVGSQGIFDGNVVTAMLRGGTPVYASPRVRKLFFNAKSLPATERMTFLEANKITHSDDFFALGATIFDMFAECGWREGWSVAEKLGTKSAVDLVRSAKLRVAMPEGMLPVLQACFDSTAITVDTVVERLVWVRSNSSLCAYAAGSVTGTARVPVTTWLLRCTTTVCRSK